MTAVRTKSPGNEPMPATLRTYKFTLVLSGPAEVTEDIANGLCVTSVFCVRTALLGSKFLNLNRVAGRLTRAIHSNHFAKQGWQNLWIRV